MKYDVIIIGAGPGGIFTAYELLKKKPGVRLTVLLLLLGLAAVAAGAILPRRGKAVYALPLLFGLLLESANDAAVALSIHVSGDESAFAALMNETAEKLGISRSYVSRIEKRAIQKLKKMYDSSPLT